MIDEGGAGRAPSSVWAPVRATRSSTAGAGARAAARAAKRAQGSAVRQAQRDAAPAGLVAQDDQLGLGQHPHATDRVGIADQRLRRLGVGLSQHQGRLADRGALFKDVRIAGQLQGDPQLIAQGAPGVGALLPGAQVLGAHGVATEERRVILQRIGHVLTERGRLLKKEAAQGLPLRRTEAEQAHASGPGIRRGAGPRGAARATGQLGRRGIGEEAVRPGIEGARLRIADQIKGRLHTERDRRPGARG